MGGSRLASFRVLFLVCALEGWPQLAVLWAYSGLTMFGTVLAVLRDPYRLPGVE